MPGAAASSADVREREERPTPTPVEFSSVFPNRVVASVSLAVVVPLVLGLCVLAVVVIVIGPSRRVRAERPLDPDTEAALLLGEDPDTLEHEIDADERRPREPDGRHRDAS